MGASGVPDVWDAYAAGVLDGSVTAGEAMRASAARYFAFRNRDDILFDRDRVTRVTGFFGLLRHFKDASAGKTFVLEPWQQFIIACVYGFVWKDDPEVRVCNNVYIEVSRKNGKTAFAAGLCLYHLAGDGVQGAEVDLAANSREQANIAFDFAATYARQLNTKNIRHFKTLRKEIHFGLTNSKMNVFASDASKLDGFNASMYLIDEYHAAKDTTLRDVLQSSQANRANPLEVIITTAGFDKNLPCYLYRESCLDVMRGISTDDTLWAFVYSMDDGDDWTDEKNWLKCSPNLGVSVNERFLRSQVNKAKNNSGEEVGIRTKTFNTWMDSAETWIPSAYVTRSMREVELSDYYDPADPRVYAGVDLSSTTDLTAVSFLVENGGIFYFKTLYYLPSESVAKAELSTQYREWVARGHLRVTPGNVVDYEYILRDILAQDKKTMIKALGYDSWNATQFAISAYNAGIPMQKFAQNIGNFNQPTKEMERLLLSGRVVMDANPITKYCFSNVELRVDHNGNAKPDKGSKLKKIDGVIAMLEALGVYLLDDSRDRDISL